ncbi:MAG TPA: 30S ribosomal protein S7 [Candidatus Vogelbacteria bacterium]|nr:30S ribosomal protein S7 [Candidatus Vogelbacteria bacterium]
MRGKVKKLNLNQLARDAETPEEDKLIKYIMERGKKNLAKKIVRETLKKISEETKTPGVEIFKEAIKNTSPQVEVRSRRVGGANYQVPYEVRPERQLYLSLKWIIDSAKAKKGSPMADRLAKEIILASKGEGEAVKKRENTHKMAEANRAFAHFGWVGRNKK